MGTGHSPAHQNGFKAGLSMAGTPKRRKDVAFLNDMPEEMIFAMVESGKSIGDICIELGIGKRALDDWIEERLSLPDFVPNPVMTRFMLDDFLRGNALERAQVYEILNRIGAMSVEQIQEEEDLIR